MLVDTGITHESDIFVVQLFAGAIEFAQSMKLLEGNKWNKNCCLRTFTPERDVIGFNLANLDDDFTREWGIPRE